mmetsp:Transcript_37103/g.75692  ORF Transcript_37103/g.75692 Transcript_37103/m.75692 type:complete len:623 (+) Transcript_37103:113-1981(+)
MVSCPSQTLAAVVVNMLAVTTTSFAFNLPHHNSRTITRTITMLHSSRGEEMNNNMPTADEIMTQKGEAYNALSSFHETSTSQTQSDQVSSLLAGLDTMGLDGGSDEEVKADYWECADGAITYSVSMDPAAGIKKGRISKPYKSSVRIDMGELMSNNKKEKGLRLVESMQFDQSTLPFVRSISLGANVDVDSVDSSYSLDAMLPSASASDDEDYTSLPLLPSSLLNGIDPSAVEFVVEHTLAVSELERSRCFLLYGCINDVVNNNVNDNEPAIEDDDFAILAATTAAENAKRKRGNDQTATDDRSYRLIGLILAEERKVMPTPEIADTTRTSLLKSDTGSESEAPSPLDFLEIKGQNDDEEEDKMERLMQSLENHNKKVIEEGMGVSDQNASEMQLYNVGMFGLTSGVWLGDAFIRESIIPPKLQQTSSRGFGKKEETKNNDDEEEDRFATWSIGVQKVTMQFEWDYGTSIAQKCNWGRCMGTATSLSSMANIRSEGLIVVNEARRMKKREEKRVILDFDGGNYIAGLIGSSYFRAPRYMTFSQKSQSIRREPYLTEYMIFFRPKSDKASSSATTSLGSIEDVDTVPEYYCSRSSRLYDSQDGSLMQGSTGFFALQQPQIETE